MGIVYKAKQIALNRIVALKMIRFERVADQDRARFHTEAEAIARLQQPGIVQIYEIGELEGRPFFSLEFCEGGSLDVQLRDEVLLPAEAASLGETLARSMHAVHQVNVIHRDLKPANVLLTADGSPKITDFGLAKKFDDVAQTQSGTVMGTPSYMAPEQASGQTEKIGPAVDVYALGAILYECLTGRPPFKAATVIDTLLQVLRDDPVSPRRLNSRIPFDLETICLKCLAKHPIDRYDSALSLAEDLKRFQSGEPITARPMGSVERTWRWCKRKPALAGMWAVIALLAVALGVGGPLVAWNQTVLRQRESIQRARAEAEWTRAEEERNQSERNAYNAQLRHLPNLIDSRPFDARNLLFDESQLPVRLRDFSWGTLHRRLEKKSRVLNGHRDLVKWLVFSPDSSRLASVDHSGTIKLWDALSGRPLQTLFQPGKRLSLDKWRRIRATEEMMGYRYTSGAKNPVSPPRFSASGRYLAAQLQLRDRRIPDDELPAPPLYLFDLQENGKYRVVEQTEAYAFSPNEALLVTADQSILRLHWLESDRKDEFNLPVVRGTLVDLVVDHTGKKVFVVTGNDRVSKVDLEVRPLSLQPLGQHEEVQWLVDAKQHSLPGAGKIDLQQVKENSLEKMRATPGMYELLRTHTNPDPVLFAYVRHERPDGRDSREISLRAVDGDGQRLLTTRYLSENLGERMKLRVPGKVFSFGTRNVTPLNISPNGRHLATAIGSWNIRLWDLQSTEVDWRTVGHSKPVQHLQFSEDGSQLFSVGADRKIVHWDVERGTLLHQSTFPVDKEQFYIHLSRSGKLAFIGPIRQSGPSTKWISLKHSYVWDVLRERTILQPGMLDFDEVMDRIYLTDNFRSDLPSFPPLVSHDERWLIGSSTRNKLVVWDFTSGKVHHHLRTHGELRNCVFSPKGILITFSYGTRRDDRGRYVQFWDITEGRLLRTQEVESLEWMTNSDSPFVKEVASRFPKPYSIQKISPNGRFLGFRSRSRFDIEYSTLWYDLQEDRRLATGEYITPDGGKVMSISRKDRTLTIHDMDSSSTQIPLAVDDVSFDWSVDGQTMFAANLDSTFSCYDSLTGTERVRYQTGLQTILQTKVSPRGNAVALGDEEGNVAVIRASYPLGTR